MELATASLETPLGRIIVVAAAAGVCAIEFEDRRARMERWLERRFGEVKLRAAVDPCGAVGALERYFDGELSCQVPLDLGGSEMQARVWGALRSIPAGTTTTYGALAKQLGRPAGASRAIGLANGANPVAIVVPCHRVIGKDGSLTGYAGGLERKRWLLEHEMFGGAQRQPLTSAGTAPRG